MERHNPIGFAFMRRRAEQLFEEGMTAGAIRLLKAVDDAQVRRFEPLPARKRRKKRPSEILLALIIDEC